MLHQSPITKMFGYEDAEDLQPDRITDVQSKLRAGGFNVPDSGELDECTCAALRLVGGPKDLIEQCGDMGGDCSDKRIAALLKQREVKSKSKPVENRTNTPLFGDVQVSPEIKKIGFLLAASAASVCGLYFIGRKQAERTYSSVGQEIVDVPFKEIEGEKVNYEYSPPKLTATTNNMEQTI